MDGWVEDQRVAGGTSSRLSGGASGRLRGEKERDRRDETTSERGDWRDVSARDGREKENRARARVRGRGRERRRARRNRGWVEDPNREPSRLARCKLVDGQLSNSESDALVGLSSTRSSDLSGEATASPSLPGT